MSLKRDDDFYKTKKSKEFYWNDVKDYFIPFLIQLIKDYELDNLSGLRADRQIRFWNYEHNSYIDYTLDDVINDKVKNKKIVEIVFHILDK